MNRMRHTIYFYAEFNRFEFIVFLRLDRLQYHGERALPDYLLIAGGRIV